MPAQSQEHVTSGFHNKIDVKMAKMLAQEELAAMSSADEDDYAPAARATLKEVFLIFV